jgi:hypothetical protein
MTQPRKYDCGVHAKTTCGVWLGEAPGLASAGGRDGRWAARDPLTDVARADPRHGTSESRIPLEEDKNCGSPEPFKCPPPLPLTNYEAQESDEEP